jgi:putative PIN family toxin of toxin-antitoxin system
MSVKAVLDTNVLVSAMLSPGGNPEKIFDLFLNGKITLFYSADALAEYIEVLSRPRFGFGAGSVWNIVSAIEKTGLLISPERSNSPMPDERDRVFYDIAKTAWTYLVTGNLKHYPKCPFILSPSAFLSLLITPIA